MSEEPRFKFSAIVDASSTIEEYNWHLNALRSIDEFVHLESNFDVMIDGRSLTHGAFDEAANPTMHDELRKFVLQATRTYLQDVLSHLKSDLRDHGIDPDA